MRDFVKMSKPVVAAIFAAFAISMVHLETLQPIGGCKPHEITNAHIARLEAYPILNEVQLAYNITCDDGYVGNTGEKLQKNFIIACLFGNWVPPSTCEKITTTTTEATAAPSTTAENVHKLSNCPPLEISNAQFDKISIDFNEELFAGGLTYPGYNVTCDDGYLVNTGTKLQNHFRIGCLYGQWMPPFDIKCEKIPIPTEYCGFDTGDECGWLQIVTERAREVAVFTVSSGPSADYMPGARPKGVAGGHESTNYAVLKAAHYPKDLTADIRILPMKGAYTRCLRMKYCLSSGGKLKVLVSNQGTVWERMQTPAGYQEAAIQLTNIGSRTTVSLSAIRGVSAAGDIVIDSIEYKLGGCN